MAYEKPITIKEAIDSIQKKKFVLPSIQREFVWELDQIEKLFDSLMRDYPISTFLFWHVDKNKINDFQFYEFLRDFHERDCTHNPKASLANDEDVIAVLDGQQRLTSLYIALKGTFAEKMPYYAWDNNKAFQKKKLYLNLLKGSDSLELIYDFKFLSDEEIKDSNSESFWYEVGKILDVKEYPEVMNFLIDNKLADSAKYSTEQIKFAAKSLNTLFNVIHQKGTINYFLERSPELDKVLQIFIRINSGGTKLSYSDLLLSIATAQWKERDAREEIHTFVDEINKIGQGFNFDKDFVLKSCLVLADFSDIKFKVDNFTKANMAKIESKWEALSSALGITVKLVSSFGFNRDSLTSYNTLIPIAYYLSKIGGDEQFIYQKKFEQDREKIKQWLLRVVLKKTFSGTPDAIYPQIRKLIKESEDGFPLSSIIELYRGTPKSIIFNEDDIDALLDREYGNQFTFSCLALLYPELNLKHTFHMDHIFPKKFFTDIKLRKIGLKDNLIKNYLSYFNKLPNLQLLEGNQNKQKNGTDFKVWLQSEYGTNSALNSYQHLHMIPNLDDYGLENFEEFFLTRRELLKEKLRKSLTLPNL